ncbi:MAG: HAMP domain-containing sensor histidine kinase [bacterium]
MLKEYSLYVIKSIYAESVLQKIMLFFRFTVESKESTSVPKLKDPEYIKSANISKSLAFVSLLTIFLMTIYESVKSLIWSNLTLWQSHTITILFAGFIAPIGAYFALKRIEALRQKALLELDQKNSIGRELQKAHNNLEIRVKERTMELNKINELLKEEINLRKNVEHELRINTNKIIESKELLEEKNLLLLNLNDQLADSEKELKDLVAAKDKFFSILAHDLRSPFNALLGSTEMLEREAEELNTDEIKEFAKSINNSSKSFYKLLENLLQWSRMQTGRIVFQPTVFNIQTMINEVCNLFSHSAKQKNISIQNYDNEARLVYADHDMIDTIIRNLISNAIKFTNENGTIIIKIVENNNHVYLSIQDTGVGIPKNKIDKLFSLKENNSTRGTKNEKGTGLGLILCREFIEINGGKLITESTLGIGSTFTINIPKSLNN